MDDFPPNPPFNAPKGKSTLEVLREAQAADYLVTAITTVSRQYPVTSVKLRLTIARRLGTMTSCSLSLKMWPYFMEDDLLYPISHTLPRSTS